MVRKTEEPLNGLVYDYAENGKRIEFGYLVNGYQDGSWKFFHEKIEYIQKYLTRYIFR